MPLFNPPVTQAAVTLTASKTTTSAITTTAVSILSAEPTRRGLTITNPSTTSTFFIDTVNTVSATDYMVPLPPGAYYELPITNGTYTGALFAICPSGYGTGGTLLLREFKP